MCPFAILVIVLSVDTKQSNLRSPLEIPPEGPSTHKSSTLLAPSPIHSRVTNKSYVSWIKTATMSLGGLTLSYKHKPLPGNSLRRWFACLAPANTCFQTMARASKALYFKEFYILCNIKQCFFSAYHSMIPDWYQTAQRSIAFPLRNFVNNKQITWDKYIGSVTWALTFSGIRLSRRRVFLTLPGVCACRADGLYIRHFNVTSVWFLGLDRYTAGGGGSSGEFGR